ncbi:hypothetical protein [Catenovulum agarivorans]|uniref:hypothetical protein n=1 Tax=Catenovulum agarivorans TaxID=1172192 RepID=UPI0002DF9EC7|nr:hypothetical protein [Catenovulum agarivorans]
MKEFEFTLKFALANPLANPSEYVENLGAAGCDDAIIGLGQKGRIALQFNREADNAYKAVTSAIDDVKKAIPDATLIESTPDLVGLSDIADLMGFSRQYIRKLMTQNANFPIPVHAGNTAIWHLSNFFNWYESAQNKTIELAMKEVAAANMQINLAKEFSRLDTHTKSQIASLSMDN